MPEPFVQIQLLNVQYATQIVLDNLSWTIERGQHWLIGGKSGTGKTTLGKALAGVTRTSGNTLIHFDTASHLPAKAYYISNWFQFTNLEGDRNFYYQQRYNKHQGQDTLTVKAELEHFAQQENLDFTEIESKLIEFGFANVQQSQLIELSSGEHKKLQLVKGLWLKPQLLIIDEPYTGLDKNSRIVLNLWLDELADEGVHLVIISNDTALPNAINHFTQLREGKIDEVTGPLAFVRESVRQPRALPTFLKEVPHTPYDTIVRLSGVHIRYGEKNVLKNVSWEVKVGEKWVLQGPNGSGKSTLLSLINGDHPQSYGMDILLFGNKRGSGESIWDIKHKIGIISPEMHWYFDQNATVWHTIASGFYDSIGWFIDVKFQEQKQIEELMAFFDLTEYKNQLLHTLPLGKQRLALLARTIIKNPPLLVLDEPCQGLDSDQTQYFNDVVDELAQHGKTLIYVGHYESQLPKCIEHRIVLEQGEVIAIENILENV
ncbi:ATP-binding cassette domain-containing protein [Sphingobacterium alkalisoli]|uniref:ATP-binding cassette domain-containing protein n=1 Tax=Sphingobacterium alkalisoli TaxID=1874115 RepID=A0A4U0H8Z9_9SPHI|nr:ATP-binding cassette domain-containing protein [Sphingobacterium alkalisoli]TJY68347.1 ATP-binding cassette domain-containing protein [Sphingobacterium alkalisoli]GGH07145.1 molybdenum ABC transporter ATP-binding protein [Sphingobacterium alkalisoli]